MATIETRTSTTGTTYRVKVRLKGYPTQTATFKRLTDARKWAQQTESAIQEGRHFKTSEAKKHTLASAIDRYIRDVLPTKPKSIHAQTIHLNWWKNEIGAYVLADITPAVISAFRDKLGSQETSRKTLRSPATVNRYLAALSHLFTTAYKEWGWINDNPFRKISKKKESRGRVRFLSDEEREILLKECKKSKSNCLYLIVVLALSTGSRKGEILNLKWNDVDLNRRVITLHETKNGEIRVLPLVSHAFELMKQHAQIRHLNCNFVFPSKDFTKPVDIRTPFENAVERAGISDFRFHDLRHCCASYLAMNGASLAEIAEVLGHKTLQMVKRYSHLSEAHTAKVVESMNNKIFSF